MKLLPRYYIRGDKPSGYGVTLDKNFRKVEQEFRQCSHCQASWVYQPGSGKKFGMCTHCMGLLCNKCIQIQWKKVDNKCLPFYDTALENSNNYVLDTNVGIFLRKK